MHRKNTERSFSPRDQTKEGELVRPTPGRQTDPTPSSPRCLPCSRRPDNPESKGDECTSLKKNSRRVLIVLDDLGPAQVAARVRVDQAVVKIFRGQRGESGTSPGPHQYTAPGRQAQVHSGPPSHSQTPAHQGTQTIPHVTPAHSSVRITKFQTGNDQVT